MITTNFLGPISTEKLNKVIEDLNKSLRRKGRPLWVHMHHPEGHKIITCNPDKHLGRGYTYVQHLRAA